jgi:hypothetical protein
MALPPLPERPRVSVVIPCRDEKGYIGPCIQSVLSADRAGMELVVLVCDGMSSDGTRDEIARYAKEQAIVRLVDNPQRTTPYALNAGLRHLPVRCRDHPWRACRDRQGLPRPQPPGAAIGSCRRLRGWRDREHLQRQGFALHRSRNGTSVRRGWRPLSNGPAFGVCGYRGLRSLPPRGVRRCGRLR